jgi:hypothetical protein
MMLTPPKHDIPIILFPLSLSGSQRGCLAAFSRNNRHLSDVFLLWKKYKRCHQRTAWIILGSDFRAQVTLLALVFGAKFKNVKFPALATGISFAK